MGKNNFNKRHHADYTELPMQVKSEIIELCRQRVEPKWKRIARQLLLPFYKHKYKLKSVGEGCQFGKNSTVTNATLGDYAYFGPRCEFNGPVIIGSLTMISSEVQIIGQDHDSKNPELPMRIAFPQEERPVTVIEADCWIGSRVTIMEGVRIGRGSIIGAASIVTKSIPPYSIAVGSPAIVIRKRFDEDTCKKHDNLLYGKFFSF